MRLKAAEGPLAVHNQHNQNNDIFSSPKRINTLQNSRYIIAHNTNNLRINNTNNFYDNTNSNSSSVNNFLNDTNSLDLTPNLILESNNGLNDDTQTFYGFDAGNLTEKEKLDGVGNGIKVQWCNTTDLARAQEESHQISSAQNRICSSNQRNINNVNLATQLRIRAQPARPEYCPEPPSPDDVLIRDDLDDQQSCSSSFSASPEAENKALDVSDSTESSDEGNVETVKLRTHPQNIRCIVNPNYPGFQHLAHTLIEGYDEENATTTLEIDNNANNNNPEEVLKIDKFDSVNRLDSIENIQKIFHDKTVLDIHPIELGDSPSSTAQELIESTTSIDQNTLVESTASIEQDIPTVDNLDESTVSIGAGEDKVDDHDTTSKITGQEAIDFKVKDSDYSAIGNKVEVDDVVSVKDIKLNDKNIESVLGDLSKEIEDELDRVGLSAEQFEDQLKELELVADKLRNIADPSPSVLKKYFEPNCSEPFETVHPNDLTNFEKLSLKYQEPREFIESYENKGLSREEFGDNEHCTSSDIASGEFNNNSYITSKCDLESLSGNRHRTNEKASTQNKEVVRPSTLDLPARHIKRPLENILFSLEDENAEDLKAEQLIMSAKLIRTPIFEFDVPESSEATDLKDCNHTNANEECTKVTYDGTNLTMTNKMVDAALSSAKESIPSISLFKDVKNVEKNEKKREWVKYEDMKKGVQEAKNRYAAKATGFRTVEDICTEKFSKEDFSKNVKEKDTDSSSLSKKAKFSNYIRRRIDYSQQFGSLITFPRRVNVSKNRDPLNRRSVPMAKKRTGDSDALDEFDVYNIETAMPKINLEAIESHLKAAREEERRRRTDREEIRRRLAMGSEDDYYSDRPGRKPSLQSRLQSGMNLQICFMNETVSDTDSPTSDSESPVTNPKQPKFNQNLEQNLTNNVKSRNFEKDRSLVQRPATLPLQPQITPNIHSISTSDADFFTKQARLQTEARMALAQAKEMAKMQMEIEKQRQKKSPITEMIRSSLEKVGIPFPEEKRRLSRQILTEMNVAQLQVIVNDLHTQIETLNENLVKFLMNRDDLHMEQDSMLVDIEDLTRYLSAKEQVVKDHSLPTPQNNNLPPPSPAPPSPLQTALNNTVRPHLTRIASLVKK